MKKILFAALAVMFFACKKVEDLKPESTKTSTAKTQNPDNFQKVSLSNLNLNRVATKLTSNQKKDFEYSHTGFIWNDGDNATTHWRPQGIAGINKNGTNWLAVTWYGREKDGDNDIDYRNRGARISLVNVTSMNNIKYRHVLLVNKSYNTFYDIHAGGLAYVNGEFHLPDTRTKDADGNYKIHVFSVNNIKEVPNTTEDRERFYGYRYILVKSRTYKVPVKPSFLSYDWSRKLFVTGKFNKDGKEDLFWYDQNTLETKKGNVKYSKLQGGGSDGGVVWISRSYGRNNRSVLEVMRLSEQSSSMKIYDNNPYFDRIISYPAGLENLHVSKTSDNIWMLTEFGPKEKSSEDRIVFAVDRDKIMPW